MDGFLNQTNALFRKNLSYLKRHLRENLRIILFPLFIFGIIGISKTFSKSEDSSPGKIIDMESQPLLQVPYPEFRAVRSGTGSSSTDLPNDVCRQKESCPATILITGGNRTLAEGVANAMLKSDVMNPLLGTPSEEPCTDFASLSNINASISDVDASLYVVEKVYQVQSDCLNISSSVEDDPECVQGLSLWRTSYNEINNELYKGYQNGNPEAMINEFMGAYDFQDSSRKNFNVYIGYNSTYQINPNKTKIPNIVRIQKAENMIANGFLQYLFGPSTKMILESVSEMPYNTIGADVSVFESLMVILCVWMVLQLFPVLLETLVYEKQQKLRMMMQMHGLENGAYWVITYIYFLFISTLYICGYLIAGSLSGLIMFTNNSKSVQFTFYFVYINLQISMSFLLSPLFKRAKGCAIVGIFMVLATGLLGMYVFGPMAKDPSVNSIWVMLLELYPGFALYRGIDELCDYAIGSKKAGTFGIQWYHLKDINSGMREVLIIMTFTWILFLLISYCVENISSIKSHLSSKNSPKSITSSNSEPNNIIVEMEKQDISQEREKIEQLKKVPNSIYSAICFDLKKIYPGRDGNPDKYAVKGASVALSRGECFGMLGPNGAGKTTFISMMIGLLDPTFGTASIEGLDLLTQMHMIHTIMGVCPQYDLLWDTLTGREHLRFYGRLRNITGSSLNEAVEDALRGVGLLKVGDKGPGEYSGGMKRRLSVAIALIGNPKIVYLDEPSTGLDPASRNKLWEVILQAKKDKTIVLTTHSMEEAERLCDRIGIFADGCFQCLGSSDELKHRYGDRFILTLTTKSDNIDEVQSMIQGLFPNATRTYCLSGTQKFELSKTSVKKSDIFGAIKSAKKRFPIQTWGVTETTLEDVFIKVASEADASII